jgi:hypothetical protein
MSIVGQLRLTARVAPGEPDGWTTLNDDCRLMLREAANEIERLRTAIWPLAREADNWTDDVDGDTRILFTLELCRKARSALQSR